MKNVYVKDLLARPPDDSGTVQIFGWLKARRKHGRTIFLDIADSTGVIQAVVNSSDVGSADFGLAKTLARESAVKITGTIVCNGKTETECRELRAKGVELVGQSSLDISPHPRGSLDIFDPRYTEQLLDQRHFYLRNPKIAAILRFRDLLTMNVHRWFHENGYMEIHAPVLTPTPLYDDKTPIGVTIHGQNVFLTQCVGFYLEQAVHSFERVYNMGPSFRAEESRSKRHLMEYWHIKAEIAFVDLEDLMGIVEQFMREVPARLAEEGADLLKTIGTKIDLAGLTGPFPRIDYGEAVEWVRSRGADIEFGKSLGSDEEEMLSEKFGGVPFWVERIPRAIEPFPYVIDDKDPCRTKTADLIASRGFGELLGIAEKTHSLEMLDERLKEKGKHGDARYEWLRDLRRYGCVPHGGIGMGMERLIRWLLDIPHVRDTIPFHRAFGRRIHP